MRSVSLLLAFTALALSGCAARPMDPAAATPEANILPLRTLRLYETGVGYFERSGTVDGRTATSLPVPAGHLDDALASLVVLNAGAGGAAAGLSFASSVTKATARSRAGLPADDSPIAFRDLLSSMKGEMVSVVARDDRPPLRGRVIEVGMEVDEVRARALAEHKDAKEEEPKHLVVTLLLEDGAVAVVPVESIARIRPVDPAFASRLDAALDALGKRSPQNARAMHLLGSVRGAITFGYVAETPIWRASYRLIEAGHGESSAITASLQGWALLHNDTDESWHDVHLDLVNGEPDSFVFPMAAPRYARRALVHPDEALSTLPQLQDTTADALWGDHVDPSGGEAAYAAVGYGSGSGRLSGGHQSRAPAIRMGRATIYNASPSQLLEVGNLADLARASGVEQGAQFVYTVPGGVSLEAHASALVPFVQRSVSVESVALFAGPGATGRTAVRFVNTTGQTLPTGTIAVFGSGGYLGETSLDRLKPGEQRFLSIGNDLDVGVTRQKTQVHEESKRLSLEGDVLKEHFLRTTDETWLLENRATAARTLYVELSADRIAKVQGADRVEFDEATGKALLVFVAKPREKSPRTLAVVEGLSRGVSLDALTDKMLRALFLKTTIAAKDLATLAQALPRVQALEASHTKVDDADREATAAQADMERLREDLKSLGGAGTTAGGSTAAAPLVKRLLEAEDRVDAARKSKEATEKTLGERRESLRQALKKLEVSAE